MNNLVKILIGLLFLFVIVLTILKQPLHKCHHRHREGLNPNDPEGLEKSVQNIETSLKNMKTSFASQESVNDVILKLNDIKKDISSIKQEIETIRVRFR